MPTPIFYTSSESWINKLSIGVWKYIKYLTIFKYNYLKIWNLREQNNQNIERIAFKDVQIKFLTMYISNKKYILIYLW